MALSLADTRRRARAKRAGDKLSKVQADYGKSSAPTKHSCGICVMFEDPASCSLVAGKIRAEYGCKFFEAKRHGWSV